MSLSRGLAVSLCRLVLSRRLVDGRVSNVVSIRSLVAPVGALVTCCPSAGGNRIAGHGRLAAVMAVDPLLDRIDAYCDAVPRTAARAEAHGPLTLFVNDGPGWSFYARPTRGTATVTPTDVDRVRARQRQLGIPETFEWIAEVTPSLGPAARATGLAVTDHPRRSHLAATAPSSRRQ